MIALQQLFGILPRLLPGPTRHSVALIWNFLYPTGDDGLQAISILYTIVPWVGVMAAGYGFGLILLREPAARDRWCLRVGLSATAIFLLVASVFAAVQHPSPAPPFWARMLNQQKYPASQWFLLMTLGPTIALMPWAERARGWFGNVAATFGRVPMFYYLLHIPTIHLAALLVYRWRFGGADEQWFATAPYSSVPAAVHWSLPCITWC